jgi:hypothetical protein
MEDEITLSPNPGKEGTVHTLKIFFKQHPGDVSIDLKNMNGATILSRDFENVKDQVELSLPAMARGLYLIKVQGQRNYTVMKYLVQ